MGALLQRHVGRTVEQERAAGVHAPVADHGLVAVVPQLDPAVAGEAPALATLQNQKKKYFHRLNPLRLFDVRSHSNSERILGMNGIKTTWGRDPPLGVVTHHSSRTSGGAV